MYNVLREHFGIRCLVYMDHIIVFSTSLKEHLDNLRKIFDTLRKYNMKIQLDKSEFLHKEGAFLRHIVTCDTQTLVNLILSENSQFPKTKRNFEVFLAY